jgi:hypothetical protein
VTPPDPTTGEVIYEAPLDDGSGWMAAVYLGMQAGRWIVTELRVFPSAERAKEKPGEWAHSEAAQEAAPNGGLTTTALRAVAVSQLAADALRESRKWELVGLTLMSAGMLPGNAPGAHGRDDTYYARLARMYLYLVQARHPRPVKELADFFGVSVRTTESQIREARNRGLLTRPEPGRSGGELTDKARDLLKEQGDES